MTGDMSILVASHAVVFRGVVLPWGGGWEDDCVEAIILGVIPIFGITRTVIIRVIYQGGYVQ